MLIRLWNGFAASVLMLGMALFFGAADAFAQAVPNFPVDSAGITNLKADITNWGAALIGVALAILAYRVVRRVVR